MSTTLPNIYSTTITSTDSFTVNYPSISTGTTYTVGPSWGSAITAGTLNTDPLVVRGDASFDGDIKIKGKSLSDRLDKIEERLAILHPNKKLEEKWERLKSLGEMYRELEKEIIEKEHIWASLKK